MNVDGYGFIVWPYRRFTGPPGPGRTGARAATALSNRVAQPAPAVALAPALKQTSGLLSSPNMGMENPHAFSIECTPAALSLDFSSKKKTAALIRQRGLHG
jgi:hypothetical protein